MEETPNLVLVFGIVFAVVAFLVTKSVIAARYPMQHWLNRLFNPDDEVYSDGRRRRHDANASAYTSQSDEGGGFCD